MKKILILLILMIILLSMGEIYRTDVDTTYGFYQVRNDVNSNDSFKYLNHTLNINVGDTVTWRSMDDFRITIVSEDNLWGNTSGILPRSFKEFNYTFNNAGIYRVHLMRYQRLHQTIVVKELTLISNTPVIYKNEGKISEPIGTLLTPNVTINTTSILIPESKKSSGFELIIAIFGLILISRKI